jgi:molybdate transport system ATP-binding protein
LSALNVLPATVTALRMGDGPGALIRLSVGGDPLLVRITRRSAMAMGLAEGAEVFAIVKSVSVAQADIGVL